MPRHAVSPDPPSKPINLDSPVTPVTPSVPPGDTAKAGAGVQDRPRPDVNVIREGVRGVLAYVLISTLVGVSLVLAGLTVYLVHHAPGSTTAAGFLHDLTQGVFTPIVALVGTALGFYFGQTSVGSTSGQSGSSGGAT